MLPVRLYSHKVVEVEVLDTLNQHALLLYVHLCLVDSTRGQNLELASINERLVKQSHAPLLPLVALRRPHFLPCLAGLALDGRHVFDRLLFSGRCRGWLVSHLIGVDTLAERLNLVRWYWH